MKLALKEDIYRIDKECVEKFGIPVLIMMENAGRAAFGAIKDIIPEYKSKKFLLICGPGNNGGDGAVLARLLFTSGVCVHVFYTGPMGKTGPDARINFSIIGKIGIKITEFPYKLSILEEALREADVVVDAIFGIGFHGEADDFTSGIIDSINKSGKTVVSIDIPSGLQADGHSSEHSVKADFTVTFGLSKLGMTDFPGRQLAGRILTDPISIPPDLLKDPSIKNNLITAEDILRIYIPRKRDTNKGSFGHLLIAGGTPGMSGAVILAGKAALKAGVGLLSIAAPETALGPVRRNFPEALTFPIGGDIEGFIRQRRIRTVLAGNGFSTGMFQKSLMEFILSGSHIERLVIDADGLNNIADSTELELMLKNSPSDKILTPHIGEMARLVHRDNSWVKHNKFDCARQFATDNKIHLVLKDSISLIASPDGEIYASDRGSASLAKGGSGDILAGLIAGLWASGYSSLASCQLGAYLLGRAGEIYEEKWGSESASARDILKLIPAVFSEINRMIHRS
jgi:NAD(P)H-hydrate epimerase